MFGFGRKKKSVGTAKTFVEATGGGWSDLPDTVAADGGKHADYVEDVLHWASEYAHDQEIGIGEEFEFTLSGIPRGITSPHEIIFGLMARAHDYGLDVGVVHNETARFIRLK